MIICFAEFIVITFFSRISAIDFRRLHRPAPPVKIALCLLELLQGLEEDGEGAIVGIKVGFTEVTAMEANHPYIIKVGSDVSTFTMGGVLEPDAPALPSSPDLF